MARLLFPDFLIDANAYATAQSHWNRVWEGVYRTSEVENPWATPWMTNPSMDGNPIFTAVCWPLRRGVRIIQEARCESGDLDLDWWLDYYGDKTDRDAICELVIACCPSVENAATIARLLRQWIESGELKVGYPNIACEPAYDFGSRGAALTAA